MLSTMLLPLGILFLVMTIIRIKTDISASLLYSSYPLHFTMIVLMSKLLATFQWKMDVMCCGHKHQIATDNIIAQSQLTQTAPTIDIM